jgi:hypothetical protein
MWFVKITGTVSDVQKWSSTSVSTSGGGGYVHPEHGGYISSPTVTSRVTQHQTFWILSGGLEIEVRDVALSCRDGQPVTLISGNKRGASPINLAIRNDITGEIALFPLQNLAAAFPISAAWGKLTKSYVHLVLLLIFLGILCLPTSIAVLVGGDNSRRALMPLVELYGSSIGVSILFLFFFGFVHAFVNRISLYKKYKSYVVEMMNVDFSGSVAKSLGVSQLIQRKLLRLPWTAGLILIGGLSIHAIIIIMSLLLRMYSHDVAELQRGVNRPLPSPISNDVTEQQPRRAQPQPQPQPQVERRPERHNPAQRQRETTVTERPSNDAPPLGWPSEVEHTRFGVIEIYSNKLYLNGKPTTITGLRKLRITKLLPWGDEDLLLVMSLGNADCPAKFTVIRLAANYLKNTPFFGNCNIQMSWGSTPDRITFSEPPFQDKPEAAYSYNPSSAELSGNY